METDGIPADHVMVIQTARDRIYMALSDKADISDELERIYRLGKSQGRIEGHDMAHAVMTRYFDEQKKRMGT